MGHTHRRHRFDQRIGPVTAIVRLKQEIGDPKRAMVGHPLDHMRAFIPQRRHQEDPHGLPFRLNI
jgi:hypothetical protein